MYRTYHTWSHGGLQLTTMLILNFEYPSFFDGILNFFYSELVTTFLKF